MDAAYCLTLRLILNLLDSYATQIKRKHNVFSICFVNTSFPTRGLLYVNAAKLLHFFIRCAKKFIFFRFTPKIMMFLHKNFNKKP